MRHAEPSRRPNRLGHSEDRAVRFGDRDELGRRVRVVGQWLFTYDRYALFEEGFRYLVVGVVRRDDRDDVDAVVAGRFPLGHLTVVVVDALYAEALCELGRRRRVPAENTCGKDVLVVQPHGVAVRGADHRSGAAADHARNQPR